MTSAYLPSLVPVLQYRSLCGYIDKSAHNDKKLKKFKSSQDMLPHFNTYTVMFSVNETSSLNVKLRSGSEIHRRFLASAHC